MIYLPLIIFILILVYGPQMWVRWVLERHNRVDEANFPGNGGELARHLLDLYGLQAVKVEVTDLGDHYDPQARDVSLPSPERLIYCFALAPSVFVVASVV